MRPSEIAKLNELLEVLTAADLSEAEIRVGERRLHVTRERTGLVRMSGAVPAHEQPIPDEEPPAVVAQMVGFFKAPVPPILPGDAVEEGNVLGAITALGLDNELRAGVSGVVAEVAVADGAPVQYGQVLYRLNPPEEAK